MENLVVTLLNMSITASFAAVFVILIRIFLKKLPKIYSYLLWLVVIFRFLNPVPLHSDFSLIPVCSEPVGAEIIYEEAPSVRSGVFFVDRPVNRLLEKTMAGERSEPGSANPVQKAFLVMLIIWELGMLVIFFHQLARYIRLKWRLGTAVEVDKRIRESDAIEGAFVLGIIRPVIYLPCGLDETERTMILAHERIHIRRGDQIVKLIGFLTVLIHWFNPFSWVSFRLMCSDMEMACDERVVKELGEGGKKSYSAVLLSAAERRSGLTLPLAFGESHTKTRIKNILNYKKPAFWIGVLTAVVLAAIAIGLITSPQKPAGAKAISIIGGSDGPTSIFVAAKTDGEEETEDREKEEKAGDGPLSFDPVAMPAKSWLASEMVKRSVPQQEGKDTDIMLDFASEDQVIFHGAFGLFEFKLENGTWEPKTYLSPEDTEEIHAALEMIRGYFEAQPETVKKSDSFQMAGEMPGNSVVDYDVAKLPDGKVAVLGGWGAGEENGRLIDVFYGYYDPVEMVMNQVYLFTGDRKMMRSPKGEIGEQRYLFSSGGADYLLRTPKTPSDFEMQEQAGGQKLKPVDRMELVRHEEGKTTVLDPMVSVVTPESQQMILAEDRLIYWGAAEDNPVSFQSPTLISLKLDGTDRRIMEESYPVYRGLSYDAPYLYYEGRSSGGEFPRPVYRMKPDFEEQSKIGEIDGSLIGVSNGTFYILDREKPAITVSQEGRLGEKWYYDKCGYDAGHYQSIYFEAAGGKLKMKLVDLENGEYVDYQVDLVSDQWWADRLKRKENLQEAEAK